MRRPAIVIRTALFAAAGLLLSTADPGSAQDRLPGEELPTVELPADLQRVLSDYEAAWQARDPQELARLFTPDGFVLSSGNPPVRGRQAIAQHYATSGGPLHLRPLAYGIDGDLAYVIGGYSPRPELPDGGKFTLTLHRGEDGRWLIISDMDNRNR